FPANAQTYGRHCGAGYTFGFTAFGGHSVFLLGSCSSSRFYSLYFTIPLATGSMCYHCHTFERLSIASICRPSKQYYARSCGGHCVCYSGKGSVRGLPGWGVVDHKNAVLCVADCAREQLKSPPDVRLIVDTTGSMTAAERWPDAVELSKSVGR